MKRDSRSCTAATGGARNNLSTKCLRGTAMALVLAAIAIPALAGQVVTDHVISESGHAQTNVPVTFGQVFKDGAVPRGATITASLDGHPIALQVDPKATNPDGSLRHAVLSFETRALKGRAKLPLVLSSASATSATGPAVSLQQLLATKYDARVSLAMKDGTTLTADVRPFLEAAVRDKSCKPWGRRCNVWLSGPIVSEWVVDGPVIDQGGTPKTNLRIYFAVRAYAGDKPGTVGKVRTDIIVGNTLVYGGIPQSQPQYTATLASGSASYTSPALTQYAYTRWHKVLWWNGERPDVYLRQNTQYIQDTEAVSRYMKLTPSAKFLASVRQFCAPLDHCDQTRGMGQTGAQAAIGPLPRWTSVYIVDPDVRAYNWMLANTDALGAYSIHYRDTATDFPVSIHRHPYVTIAAWADANVTAKRHSAEGRKYKADLLPSCTNNAVVKSCDRVWYVTGNPNTWDNAHQPDESYVPYMVTGSWYYMSELAFGASNNELWSNPGYRGYAKGLIDRSHSQVRGKAWVLREMVDAAWLLPDTYPLKLEFEADVDNAISNFNKSYSDNDGYNPLGILGSGVNPNDHYKMAPWEHFFLTWSANHAAELGFAGASKFRDWLAKFDIALMTDWTTNPTHGFCWLEASSYTIQVKDPTGSWLPTFAAVYAANFPSLVGLACNSPPMVTAMGKLENQRWQVGQMHGYASSATGFPSNLQIGLAAIADTGVAGAARAWDIFASRSVLPSGSTSYEDYPNFAIIPRSTPTSRSK